MEHIDRLRFLAWRTEFVLTPCWTHFGRYVRFIREEDGEAHLGGHFLIEDDPTPSTEPGWETTEEDPEPFSHAWARVNNDEEVRRAWDELRRLQEAGRSLRPTEETEKRIRFLEDVLNLFLRWYARAGIPFPSGIPSASQNAPGVPVPNGAREVEPIENEGHRQARYAYDHLDQANNLKGLYRTMTGGRLDGFEAFRMALIRAGFYAPGRDRKPEEKYREMAARVRSFVEEGRPPDPAE